MWVFLLFYGLPAQKIAATRGHLYAGARFGARRRAGAAEKVRFGVRRALGGAQTPENSAESAASHRVRNCSISKARSFDLEVTPWAPTRLTSCMFHPGPEEAPGASTLDPGLAQQFRRVKLPPNRPASVRPLHNCSISKA